MNELTLAASKAREFLMRITEYAIEDHNTLAEPKLRWSGPIALSELTFPAKFAHKIETAADGVQSSLNPQREQSNLSTFYTASRNLIEYATFTGQMKNKIPHGYGVLIFGQGDGYFGQWAEGLMQGKGLFMARNGNSFNGNFL